MHLYRFHFLDADGAVTHRQSVQLPTDGAATSLGHRLLAARDYSSALEIWQLNHLVYRETIARIAAE